MRNVDAIGRIFNQIYSVATTDTEDMREETELRGNEKERETET